ncbi:hydrogenase formation protein HypD [Clostridium cibarium]|uniref:Hydrogenase formation protein HypD n=1 Tax=Clostridium cibarium TaxID=2762247 RepID=A0ABR8PRW0_9CLOT|nr:hydrogenase formation protein HypD [Clostridium cibarium]MBD7910824.1 hydrogenase formation protein HypD [Clostridium cibarium]
MECLKINREIRIMEVCGTHTLAILRSGIRNIIPNNIKIVSGPGCPVCVTNQGYIDACIELSKRENIIITTFGDMINVPGTNSSLKVERALGNDIRILYSPLDAINTAKKNPDKEVVFLAIGFETTAPLIGLAIEKAKIENLKNFSVFCGVKTMPQVIRMLIEDEKVNIDGIICPGNVSTIIGGDSFKFISKELSIPAVIAGFENRDVIAAIYLLIDMLKKNECGVTNIYRRFVKAEGNKKAKEIMNKVFMPSDSLWRGLGLIKNSGLEIRETYSDYDVKVKFNIKIEDSPLVKGCICGDILKGEKSPENCMLFGNMCSPNSPVGVCMVSREGACKIYYQYINNY